MNNYVCVVKWPTQFSSWPFFEEYISDIESSYRYTIDTIPVDQKGDIPSKYISVANEKGYIDDNIEHSIGNGYENAICFISGN